MSQLGGQSDFCDGNKESFVFFADGSLLTFYSLLSGVSQMRIHKELFLVLRRNMSSEIVDSWR